MRLKFCLVYGRGTSYRTSGTADVYMERASQSVAPSTSLSEFKRKFSNMVLTNADPNIKLKYNVVKNKIIRIIETCHLSEPRKGELVVEYGQATVQGYLINIGYSPEHGSSVIALDEICPHYIF